jgi:hypothetical protein
MWLGHDRDDSDSRGRPNGLRLQQRDYDALVLLWDGSNQLSQLWQSLHSIFLCALLLYLHNIYFSALFLRGYKFTYDIADSFNDCCGNKLKLIPSSFYQRKQV